MRFVVVTGTSTGIGKTIVTAALACVLAQRGSTVTYVKPVQTGVATDEPTDAEAFRRLTECARVHQLVGLPEPLAPDTAARLSGVEIPSVQELAHRCVECADGSDVALVEGAGGVLVRLDTAGGSVLDLGGDLAGAGHDVEVLVVTSLALGTLNHTELTVRAIAAAGLRTSGLVVGAEPSVLGLAERCNLDDLPHVTGLPLLGSIPGEAGQLSPGAFRERAGSWFAQR
jgi:dethiobiotin synthetase